MKCIQTIKTKLDVKPYPTIEDFLAIKRNKLLTQTICMNPKCTVLNKSKEKDYIWFDFIRYDILKKAYIGA